MEDVSPERTVGETLEALRVSDDRVAHLRYIDEHIQLVLGSTKVAGNRHEYETWMARLHADGVFDGGWDIDQTIVGPGESSGTVFVTLAFTEPRPEGMVAYHRQSRFVVRSGRIVEVTLDLPGIPSQGREYPATD